jgi:hypothetical protein
MNNQGSRSANAVFENHLQLRQRGDTEQDIKQNFSPDVVLLSAFGVFRGHDGVRQSAALLSQQLGPSQYTFVKKLVADRFAFLSWTAHGERASIDDGADSFAIEDGLIVAQTIFYQLQPRSKSS